ncbi:type II secretion system protein [Cupriavidus agavae]|uniref:Type II secretion system protein G (GspG) n=1 Tax=Cupriavidus agavae TaxID=1001822 RepID=A0A4Q7RFL8_9BURK|nr:prepilin-type N-terminal cleavage/methylation domain-containing protein [Cupriavidus agavae]RZT31258.1 type II secretion system protein G (GspG) [Cupriavidus agavae]
MTTGIPPKGPRPRPGPGRRGRSDPRGFTLIELLVVLAIMAALMTLAVPRFATQTERAEETVLRHNLTAMRDAIDRYHADHGEYPRSLETLVQQSYLRQIPVDPVTRSATGWRIIPPPADPDTGMQRSQQATQGVYDVRSVAEGETHDGTPYSEL